MYLLDTNVLSELRKQQRANHGVIDFFATLSPSEICYVSVITIGELRRGIVLLHYRGDQLQSVRLEQWLNGLLHDYQHHILDFGHQEAQLWGRLRVPHPENPLDKQIAATALSYQLTLVTRNTKDFQRCGIPLLNPFAP
ncbi:MAG: type II toxin-antitoxin system VapC family toxin [Gammaproteobacteria bacterium]|nr:type II toxin-antitoxin system VapC family toxin [Gammaproteobacteria bacterium]